ncbi:hypothetical protein BH24ACT5_BH24ACT5_10120 [soil metagenome]
MEAAADGTLCTVRRTVAHQVVGLASVFGLATVLVVAFSATTGAVDTDTSIHTTSLDFGMVDLGATSGPMAATLTNGGGDPFGPIDMFGGAPGGPFNASQNCQGVTLSAGGSCAVTYTFAPTAAGPASSASNFTISETGTQAGGEDFSVALTGVGVDPTTTTTSSTTTTTSSTTSTTTTAAPSNTASATTAPPSGGGGGTPAEPPTAATTTSTSTTSSTIARQPLTGIVVASQPALVVKVANVDAAPQSGLNQADIVFEEIVEGRATRFAAVFNSAEANPVGPIRSARTQDVDLLLSLNDPALAYSGANTGVDEALRAAGFELLSEGAPGFFRDDSRAAPHNLYANVAQLWPQLVSSGDAVPAFEYIAPGTQVAGSPVAFAEMRVGDYQVRWDFDAAQGLFMRSQLGAPHLLTDGQASANSVVVLVIPYGVSPAGGGPEAQTLGTGRAVVYSDGHKIEGTWTRANATDPFHLEANGQPILLGPGRTWVELVDDQNNLVDG